MENGTRRGPGGEDAVHAGGTHFVVAFWVNEEFEIAVEITVGFTYGTDVIGWIGDVEGFRHFRMRSFGALCGFARLLEDDSVQIKLNCKCR